MKYIAFLVFLFSFSFCGIYASSSGTTGYQTASNDDPLPTGGAVCTYDLECNYPDGGQCFIETNQTGYCVCEDRYGDPDCTYYRKSKHVAAGLEWLCLCSGGGAGNFYLERNGDGSGQFILCLPMFFLTCVCCCFCCAACGCGDFNCDCDGVPAMVGVAIVILVGLTGCAWSLASFIMILQDNVVDGNGYALF